MQGRATFDLGMNDLIVQEEHGAGERKMAEARARGPCPAHPTTPFQVHGFAIRHDGKIVGFVDSTGQAVVLDPSDGHVLQR